MGMYEFIERYEVVIRLGFFCALSFLQRLLAV